MSKKINVKVWKRWSVESYGGGWSSYASGKCGRKKFKAYKYWSCNTSYRWQVGPKFSLKEKQAIGRAINKKKG